MNIVYLNTDLLLTFYEEADAIAPTGGNLPDYRLVLSTAIAPSIINEIFGRKVEMFPPAPVIPYALVDGESTVIQCRVEPLKDLVFASFALIKQSSGEALFIHPGEYYQTVQHGATWLLSFPPRPTATTVRIPI